MRWRRSSTSLITLPQNAGNFPSGSYRGVAKDVGTVGVQNLLVAASTRGV